MDFAQKLIKRKFIGQISGVTKMSRTKRNRTTQDNQTSPTQDNQNENTNDSNEKDISKENSYVISKKSIKVMIGILTGAASIIAGTACTVCITYVNLLKDVSVNSNNISMLMENTKGLDKLNNIEEKLDSLEANVNNLETKVENIEFNLNGNTETAGILARLTRIEDRLNIKVLSASNDMLKTVSQVTVAPRNINITKTFIKSDSIIGTDIEGNEYYAKDYINDTILLTYFDEDKEVLFLGQFNDNYHWDGYCVTNAYYSDGTLYGICESDFDDGTRLNFKSIIHEYNNTDWIYSNKQIEGDINSGENIQYFLEYNKSKNFQSTNAKITDIIYVDDFIEKTNSHMLSYYHGNTSDNLYNDLTGQAYYISYFEDGTVKTLYQGNFKDGNFNDDTNNAWYITKNKNTSYMYYKGFFNIKPTNNETSYFENNLTLDRIKEILKENDFDLELNWSNDYN